MRKREYPLISRESSKSGFAEAIRMLRLRIEKKLEQSDKKVLMVTSAKPGEGKTTVTVNLGISLAHSGKKVLIIDCDMFKPSAAKALQSRFGTGKVKIPLPESGMTATVCGIAVKNLYTVVFSGPGGTAPKQIGTADLKYLLKYVKGPFDCILLDTPPCALIGETMEVAEAADYGLLVVRQDYVSKNKILEGTRLLADCGLPLMGCVFNGIEGRLTPGGYHYGYGYGYGYGYSHSYGYGYGEDRRKKSETV
jgi:capsular exopolysaccharide synthesis family protein